MGLNFRKSIKIGPARINLSKSGIGYSVGAKGARITKSAKGKTKITAGIPGTGFSYSKSVGGKAKTKTQSKANRTPKKAAQATKTHTFASTRAPAEKSWLMAIIMAIIGFLLVGVVSFVGILILYAIIDLFTAGELPVWANWLILVVTPLCLALLAGYWGFMQMKPETESEQVELESQDQAKSIDEELVKPKTENEQVNLEPQDQAKPVDAESAKPETVVNSYEVRGVSFYRDNLLSLHEPNYLYDYKKQDLIDTCNYDVSIYKTVVKASRIDLTNEPDNPHDPTAIMVLLDDKLVGYMPKESCKHILDLMDDGRFVSASFDAYGGKYKRVNEDYDAIKDKSKFTMETGEDEYGITVYIKEKIKN